MMVLDHLVVTAPDLTLGTAWVEARLGARVSEGGRHGMMGTHNALLSLGADAYLEVIAIDPNGTPPSQPRWFALDDARPEPALTHWAARVDDLDRALASAPEGTGVIWEMARADLRWQMAVPRGGQPPWAGLFPMLLRWQTDPPAPQLPDRGVRLIGLTLTHPEADSLAAALTQVATDRRIRIVPGPAPAIAAVLSTPRGPVTLGR